MGIVRFIVPNMNLVIIVNKFLKSYLHHTTRQSITNHTFFLLTYCSPGSSSLYLSPIMIMRPIRNDDDDAGHNVTIMDNYGCYQQWVVMKNMPNLIGEQRCDQNLLNALYLYLDNYFKLN